MNKWLLFGGGLALLAILSNQSSDDVVVVVPDPDSDGGVSVLPTGKPPVNKTPDGNTPIQTFTGQTTTQTGYVKK